MYSAFVAYHGTVSEKGTERIAQSVCQTIARIDSPNAPHCGPSTDEKTFEQHMTNSFPIRSCLYWSSTTSARSKTGT